MRHSRFLLVALFLALAALLAWQALAMPTGASFTSNSTDYGPTRSPSSITTNRSTITTLLLNAIQQDPHWKAYVGNITGTLTLQDAANNTIYDWSGLVAPTGEVYASTNGSLDFSTVACAAAGTVSTAQTAMNMTGSDPDSIGNTFNSTNHTATTVAGTLLNGCNMTSLYVNNASQGKNSSADYQEFLMQDAGSNLVYVAIINDNKVGYNGQTYDFEMLVAESHVAAPHTYYFYMELG